jgi:hypothetical protein
MQMVEWQWILVAVLCTAAWLVMGFGVRALLMELKHWAGEVWLTPMFWPMLLLIAGLDGGQWVRDGKRA